MSELARATAEVWLSITEACDLGIARSSLYLRMEREQVISRTFEDGERKVLLATLPDLIQLRHASGKACRVEGIPKSVDRVLAMQVAGARWPLVAEWIGLDRAKREGAAGMRIRSEYARAGTPLVTASASIAEVPCPATLDRVAKRAREMFAAGQNGALATLGRLGVRRQPIVEQPLPDEARSYLLKLWLLDDLRTKKRVERTYRVEAKRRGWPQVSYSTIRRVIDACPGSVAFLARKGLDEFRGKASPHITRDDTQLAPGEVYNADHQEVDFFVYDCVDGSLFRPWWTLFTDMASRFHIGWTLGRTPSSLSIKKAFAHAIRPKRRPEYMNACGLPRAVYFDNGRDFRAHDLEGRESIVTVGMLGEEEMVEIRGLFPILSIVDIHALVKNAKAKPVERSFGTASTDLWQMVPGYCGRNAEEKPSARLKDMIKAHEAWRRRERADTPFISLAEAERIVEQCLFEYHTRPHRTLSRKGRELSPADFFRLYAKPRELVADRTIELLLMERRRCCVQKNGIQVDGLWYWSDELGDMYRPTGKKIAVEARLDPTDAGRAYIYSLSGVSLCEAINSPVLRTGANPEELRREMKRVRDYEKRQRRAIRTLTEQAPADALTALQALAAKTPAELDEPVVPENAIQRLVPGYDGVELRTKQPAPGPVMNLPALFDLDAPAPKPPTTPGPKIRLFDCEDDDEEPQSSAAGGRGER